MSCWRHRLRIALVCLAAWCGNAEACPTTGVALTPIGELRKGAPEPARQGNSVSVCGQVTLRPGDLPDDPGNFYIQDSTGGISVVAVKPPSYRRGEWVLVTGRATVEDETEPEITAKWLAYAGPGQMPPPRKASLREISTGKMDGWYVSVTGKVLQLATNDVRDNLVLASEAEKLEVYSRRRRGSPSALSDLTPIGAKVEIRGVAMPTSVGSPSRVRFRNSLDLLLIESPAWLETSEGQMAALATVIVVLTALGWIVALRQAVRRQTAEIRKLLE
ncbi:MAG TPA: OB-fold nucleic acid binding domain-containing protein, partial [Bryobacteraceae bacterium]|nr:OB-fold nucleic acid binding domain-containing protein [Bryobacteraceae bacterium]